MNVRTIAYSCCVCGQPTSAPAASALQLLKICDGCQAPRYAAGMKAQRTTPPQAAINTGATRK